MKLALLSDNTKISNIVEKKLKGFCEFAQDPSNAEIIVVLGGDGFMLHSIHKYRKYGASFYGVNCGSVGFLLNKLIIGSNFIKKLKKAKHTSIYPILMEATDKHGKKYSSLAFNEISLFRQTNQSSTIKVIIDKKVKIKTLIGDGILVATPAGSSAYNFSAGGPIIPLCSNLLAITPINPSRPKQWRGALIPSDLKIKLVIDDENNKRPISATADFFEFRDIAEVSLIKSVQDKVILLFDQDNLLEHKLIAEQFL